MSTMQDYISKLEQENRYLKSLLDEAGIEYDLSDMPSEKKDSYDPDQGSRIIHREITELDAKRFFGMFWGRTDVYAKRGVNKSTGEAGYYTQCHNFWKNRCPRIRREKIRCQDCDKQAYKELEPKQILAHLRGRAEDASDVIGVYPLFPDETCRFLV